jgi:hypothetical protein
MSRNYEMESVDGGVIGKFVSVEVIKSFLLFMTPKLHYCIHKRPPMNHSMSPLRPVDTSKLINFMDFHQH